MADGVPLQEIEEANNLIYKDELEKTDDFKGSNKDVGLVRQIGILSGSALLIGAIIGSGIFASPASISDQAKSPGASLFIWVGCGVIALLGALSYCELGTMFPNNSGGEYFYLGQAFGPIPAFLYSYTYTIVMKPATLVIVAITCGDYIITAFNTTNQLYSKLIAAFLIGVILFVNCASVRWATLMQNVFTVAKLIAVVMLIFTGLVRLGQGYDGSFQDAFNGTSTSVSDIAYGFYGGLWAYDGWNNLNYITEELQNPIRNLPLIIMVGIPFVTTCYVLVNVAYLTVLTSAEIATSKAVAVTLSQRLYGVMWWIIPVFVACSTFGAANGSAFTTGRLVYVSAREGHLPRLLGMVHKKRHTPLPALIFTCIIAWIMLIPESSNFKTLVNYFSFAAWTFYGTTISALLWLRIRRPDIKRPYKVFIGVPILVLLCSIYLVAAPFYKYPLKSMYCLLFILFGLVFYFAFVKYQILPKRLLQGFDDVTNKIQTFANLSMPADTILLTEQNGHNELNEKL